MDGGSAHTIGGKPTVIIAQGDCFQLQWERSELNPTTRNLHFNNIMALPGAWEHPFETLYWVSSLQLCFYRLGEKVICDGGRFYQRFHPIVSKRLPRVHINIISIIYEDCPSMDGGIVSSTRVCLLNLTPLPIWQNECNLQWNLCICRAPTHQLWDLKIDWNRLSQSSGQIASFDGS